MRNVLQGRIEQIRGRKQCLQYPPNPAGLFNLRGSDIPYNPVFFSISLITPDSVTLYIDEQKLNDDVRIQMAHNRCPHTILAPNTVRYNSHVRSGPTSPTSQSALTTP